MPLPPFSVSLPSWPISVSLLSPPFSVSVLAPPFSVSSPASPFSDVVAGEALHVVGAAAAGDGVVAGGARQRVGEVRSR